MLSFNQVALRRGKSLLFENVTFSLNQGRKIGLIGANGAGKSSLFKMILGELEADLGEVELSSNLRIAHLEQEIAATEELALQYVLGGDQTWLKIQQQLEQATAAEQYDQLASLHEQLEVIDGYTAKSRAEQLLAGLGFAQQEFNQPLRSFSGGWRIRLNLARTLMTPSDLMLLDEPTNHLDLDTILWLSIWIKRYQGTLLLISHDREFLDETVDGIAYLNHKKIDLYTGNYSEFEQVKAARMAEQQSSFEKQQRERKHMQDFVRRFRAKATKARQAQSRIKALERMELIAPAHIDSPFHFRIPQADKTSDPLLALDQANLGYQSSLLNNIRLSLHPGDRIGLLGHNGAGKSTLIKSLSEELPLLSGQRHAGTNLVMGYFSQHQVDDLDMEASCYTHIFRLQPNQREQEIRNFLGGFDFHGDKVHESLHNFSGGEKARLALAIVAYTKPNLLLLDEPTNHLDMDMRQALTIALQEFDGAILIISHDRHLLANTVDTFLLVENGKVSIFDGDLEDYRLRQLGSNQPTNDKKLTPSEKQTATTSKSKVNQKKARQLRTQIKTLETRLERLLQKLSETEALLAENATYDKDQADNLQNLLQDQLSLQDQIETVEISWMEHLETLEQLDP